MSLEVVQLVCENVFAAMHASHKRLWRLLQAGKASARTNSVGLITMIVIILTRSSTFAGCMCPKFCLTKQACSERLGREG